MIPFYETRREEIFGFRCNRLNYPLHLQATVEFVYVASGHLTVTLNGEAEIGRASCRERV